MLKAARAIVVLASLIISLLVLIPEESFGQDEFTIDKYLAIAKVDELGNLSKTGTFHIPYYLSFLKNENGEILYGTMVKTELILNKKGNAERFGLAHYAVKNVKVRKNKRIKFDVMLGDKTIQKKLKGTFSSDGNFLIIAFKNAANKKIKQTFMKSDTKFFGLYLGDLDPGSVAASNADVYHSRTGNAVMALRIMPKSKVSTAGDPVAGDYSFWYLNPKGNAVTESGEIKDAGNFFYAQNSKTERIVMEMLKKLNGAPEVTIFNDGETIKGKMGNMGGNGKSPKPKVGFFEVGQNASGLFIALRDPVNVSPGCVVTFEAPLGKFHGKGSAFQEIWTNSNNEVVTEKIFLTYIHIFPPTFTGNVKVTLTNPDGSSSTSVVFIPPLKE